MSQDRDDKDTTAKEISSDIEEVDLDPSDVDDEEFLLTPEHEIESMLTDEKARAEEMLDRLQRLQADFENYRKRMDARFAEVTKFASEEILLQVLEIYDNIQRSLEVDFSKDPEAARKGISAIAKQMDKILQKEDVHPIESLGKQFDPYYQHAVQRVSNPDEPDGIVLQEFQRGYMMKEKVLRPALVVVNRHEPPGQDDKDDNSEDD